MTVTTRWCCVSRSRRSSVSRNALAIDEDVWGGFRFPALIIRIAEFLLPGTFFAASLSLWSSSTGTVVAGVVGFVTVLCATGFAAAWYHHRLRDQLTFVGGTFFTVDTTLGQHSLQTLWSSMESTILWQAGQWRPAAMRNSYGPLMNPFVPGREWARSLVMCLSLLLAFVSAMASSKVGCSNGALVVGVAHLSGGLVLAVVRPYRMRTDGLLGPFAIALIGLACVFKSTDNVGLSSSSDAMTAVSAVLQIVRTALTVWMQLRQLQQANQKSSPLHDRASDGVGLDDPLPNSSVDCSHMSVGSFAPPLMRADDNNDTVEMLSTFGSAHPMRERNLRNTAPVGANKVVRLGARDVLIDNDDDDLDVVL